MEKVSCLINGKYVAVSSFENGNQLNGEKRASANLSHFARWIFECAWNYHARLTRLTRRILSRATCNQQKECCTTKDAEHCHYFAKRVFIILLLTQDRYHACFHFFLRFLPINRSETTNATRKLLTLSLFRPTMKWLYIY